MRRKIFPLLLVGLLSSCSSNNSYIEGKVFCFDTTVVSRLYDGKDSDLKAIESILNYYDGLSDNYHKRQGENIQNIDNTPRQVDSRFCNLLKTSFDVANEGAEYFDPLCGSLAKKWKNALANNELLLPELIQVELMEMASTEMVFTSSSTVSKIGNAELDLGGIVKGYTLDIVLDYLKSQNIEKYLINAGYSSILLGKKPTDNGYFTVKISDLDNSYLKLQDCFISTSSKSVQGVKIDGVTYSHIINPKNGSAINLNDAVLVVSNKGYLSDALSTSMMMNTVEEIKVIEKAQEVKTIVIRNREVIYCNEGLEIIHG